ncbi:uncharacterized protein TNCV_1565131 [Trichonephila clavipes]|nr:uncharacterized protein TNCV_1565131 [Trichonephila clavipes]
MGIVLSDLENEDSEIDILIGVNVAGLLFMDSCVELKSGWFLLKTRLGYVLTGRQGVFAKCNEERDTVLNVISFLVKELPVNELWNIESIGIFDPIQKLKEKNEHLKGIEEFKNSMKILPDGRYKLCLPFKSEAKDLSSNKDLTWNRHKKMCERAQRNGILDDYKVVFKEWEKLEIIEKIEEKGENSYFLPHRPIVKDDSITTKIRSVFDASARATGQSSLNDLLYKGPNLIEQIPDILERFRRSRSSDRKKGQLSLDELESAEIQLIRSVQAQSFTDEKLISNLGIFRDDNIIRVKTRITERIDAPNFLSPILLPNNCIFTQRLVEPFHLKNHHAGKQLLLRVIGGRRTVRKIWNACVKCRRFKSKSPMTDPVALPSDRVKDAAVFEVVGVDLAGPLYDKTG